MNIISSYINGNYRVYILQDGTKIRINDEVNLMPSFAESIDCTITTKCNGGCDYCYLGCESSGRHADLKQPIFDSLHEGQELALNGNDLSHPQLSEFLYRMKNRGVICNITISQKHLHNYECFHKLAKWSSEKLIYGIGISLTDSSKAVELLSMMHMLPNAVLHVIDGLFSVSDIKALQSAAIQSNCELPKLLILGYKQVGKGDNYYKLYEDDIQSNISYLKANIETICDMFPVVSFDNLAIHHLSIQDKLPENIWTSHYMGNEGDYTFYIDAVNHKFAQASLASTQYCYSETASVDELFDVVNVNGGGR